jgi:para-nitrobenzyl esterase
MTHPKGRLLLVGFLLFGVCAASDLPTQRTAGPAVRIDTGVVEGAYSPEHPKLVFFRGIPYAAPPVGELRWKPPQPPSPWRTARRATELSAACPQGDLVYHAIQRTVSTVGGDPSLVEPVGVTSEDCLYLNVLTTALHGTRPQPVMLWLHGGGGSYGRGDDRFATLAAKGVVVVTINYRLGVFGWLSHPALTAESAHQSSGNYGLLDQIAALSWVRRNIARFGGDPGNVTVFGQSSGAEYVGCLMASPLAHGLFHRAIMQSGSPTDLYRSVHHPDGEVGSAEKSGVDLAHKLGAGDGSEAIKKLRQTSTDDVLTAAADGEFDHVIDGWVLPEQPLVIFAHHEQVDVPVMIGSTARELSNLLAPKERTADTFRNWVRRNFAPIADDVLALYPIPAPADATEAFIKAGTELEVAAPARWTAQAMHGVKNKAYLYEVTWAYPSPGGQQLGAFHGIELWLMLDLRSVPHDPTGDALAEALRAYWAQFARTGDPDVPGTPAWPPYDSRTAPYLKLGTKIEPATGLHQEAFALIQRLYPTRVASLGP